MKTVLIVDDEPDVLKMEVYRVRKFGYNVITAVNGSQALELIRAQRPDIVLLDVRMPLMEGTEVCAAVKADETLKSIPVILVTASSDSVIAASRACKADDYLLKPFNHEDLSAKIGRLLGEQQ